MLIGVDIGTGGCKVTLIDHRRKRIKTSFREYETYHPKPTWSEQNPEEWYSSMVHAVKEVLKNEDKGRIDAISIDGQTHAAVLIDDGGKPLRRTIIWTDKRSVEQVNKIKKELGEQKILEITYNPIQPLFTLP
ncbi:MAG: FGGY family carbohydrate kinase, partial [Nitrososphaerota archaeon]